MGAHFVLQVYPYSGYINVGQNIHCFAVFPLGLNVCVMYTNDTYGGEIET